MDISASTFLFKKDQFAIMNLLWKIPKFYSVIYMAVEDFIIQEFNLGMLMPR